MWYDAQNNILLDAVSDLVTVAQNREFGDEKATLAEWLLCEAFERRLDPDANRALRLAAMIISKVQTMPIKTLSNSTI